VLGCIIKLQDGVTALNWAARFGFEGIVNELVTAGNCDVDKANAVRWLFVFLL